MSLDTPVVGPIPAFPLRISNEQIGYVSGAATAVFGPAMELFQRLLDFAFYDQVSFVKNFVGSYRHSQSHGLPLQDPVDVLFCLVMYLIGLVFFYFVGRLTGRLECRLFGILYNISLVCLSLYMAIGIGWTAIASGYSLWNNPCYLNSETETMRNLFWVYYVSKLPEYTDTFLMILKHNYRQVSLLHLYHHMSIFVVAYGFMILEPCGDGYWCAMVNSAIHVVMYSYYLLNMLFKTGPVREFLRKNKFIITYGQLIQFLLNFIQCIYVLFIVKESKYNRPIMWVLLFYMISMLVLFSDFLIKNKRAINKKEKDRTIFSGTPLSPTSNFGSEGLSEPSRKVRTVSPSKRNAAKHKKTE